MVRQLSENESDGRKVKGEREQPGVVTLACVLMCRCLCPSGCHSGAVTRQSSSWKCREMAHTHLLRAPCPDRSRRRLVVVGEISTYGFFRADGGGSNTPLRVLAGRSIEG